MRKYYKEPSIQLTELQQKKVLRMVNRCIYATITFSDSRRRYEHRWWFERVP